MCHIFGKNDDDYFEPETETEVAYLGKIISVIFWGVNREHDPRNGIWNDPMGLVHQLFSST